MLLPAPQPLTYLITSGATTVQTNPASEEFAGLIELVTVAVSAEVSLFQIREKNLSARVLYELTTRAVEITRDSKTRLLVNDRADIAKAAGADGVHLASHSIKPAVIRRTFGDDFLIGVSTHSNCEARAAATAFANFAVLGPIYFTDSKREYGDPLGLAALTSIASSLKPFPIVALGGVTVHNASECFSAGAAGVAGISLFQDREALANTVAQVNHAFRIVKAGKL